MPKKIHQTKFTSQLLSSSGLELIRQNNVAGWEALLRQLDTIWPRNAQHRKANMLRDPSVGPSSPTIDVFFAHGAPDMLMRYFLLLGQQQDLSPQVNRLPLQLVVTSGLYAELDTLPTKILDRLVTHYARDYAARLSAPEAKQSRGNQDGSFVEEQIGANARYIRVGFEQFKGTLGANLPPEVSQAEVIALTEPDEFREFTRELEAVEPGASSNSPDGDQKQTVAPESLFFQPQFFPDPSAPPLPSETFLDIQGGSGEEGAVEMQVFEAIDRKQEVGQPEAHTDPQPMLDQKEEKTANNSPDWSLDMLNECDLFFLLVTQCGEALQKAKSSTSNQDKREALDASLRRLAQIRTNWDFGPWGQGLSALSGDQKNSIAEQALALSEMLQHTQRVLKAHSNSDFIRTLFAQPENPRSYSESKDLFEKASETSAALLARPVNAPTPSH